MSLEITYLVSNYNKGRYIDDCLASLHAQSSNAWKCLICDDNSTDDSIKRIQPWISDRVGLIRNDRNRGVCYTLHRLINEATTDIVGVLDADDALYPEATDLILDAYSKNADAGFIYSNFTNFSHDLCSARGSGWGRALPVGGTTLFHDVVSAMRTFRVSVYNQTSGILHSPLYAEDRDMVYKMEEVTRLHCVERQLYKYRILPDSQSHHPLRHDVALSSHRLAYLDALQRRNIAGLQRVGYLLYIFNYYWRGQIHAPIRRFVFRQLWRVTRRLVPYMGCH